MKGAGAGSLRLRAKLLFRGHADPSRLGVLETLRAGPRRGKFVDYRIADRRVLRLLDQAEDLLLGVGSLIAACPRYRRTAAAHPARLVPGTRGKR